MPLTSRLMPSINWLAKPSSTWHFWLFCFQENRLICAQGIFSRSMKDWSIVRTCRESDLGSKSSKNGDCSGFRMFGKVSPTIVVPEWVRMVFGSLLDPLSPLKQIKRRRKTHFSEHLWIFRNPPQLRIQRDRYWTQPQQSQTVFITSHNILQWKPSHLHVLILRPTMLQQHNQIEVFQGHA